MEYLSVLGELCGKQNAFPLDMERHFVLNIIIQNNITLLQPTSQYRYCGIDLFLSIFLVC